ncbi:ATP synthase subunit I [Psychromonas sp. MME2]|uniref:ATP synthase subunit I n=1 Tax=unclassified Psychromonas TaxID=2614957 RepID=UPI00339BD793
MVAKIVKKNQRAGFRLLAFQLLIMLFLALILTVFSSVKSGYSALAGGITFTLPNIIFVLMAFAHAGASKTKLIIRGFYGGEAIKIVLTVILFSIFLGYFKLSLLAFYSAFFCLLISQWFAPFFFHNNNGMKNDS